MQATRLVDLADIFVWSLDHAIGVTVKAIENAKPKFLGIF